MPKQAVVMHKIAGGLLALMLLPLRAGQFLLRNKEWMLTAMAMVVVMLVSAAITLRIALHVREVTVPDLTGRTMTEASHSAVQSGVGLVIENKFYSTTVPAGRVLSQSPAADAVVRHGWQVRVTESLGPQQVTIPDTVGETVRDASVDIRRDSLDLGTLAHVEAPGDTDMVLAQTPPPNAGVDQPRVNLLLSSAPVAASNAIVMPSFIGLSSAGAIRAGSELGLTVAGIGDGPVVTLQIPGAGFRASKGDAVKVVLGGGSSAAVATPSANGAPTPVAAPGSETPKPIVIAPAPTKPAVTAPTGAATPTVVPKPKPPISTGAATSVAVPKSKSAIPTGAVTPTVVQKPKPKSKTVVVPPGPISLQVP
jgi:beta-lactam-binding protein with PASTA domain